MHCGKCLKVCPGDLFIFDDKNELKIKEIDCFVGMDVGSVIVWLMSGAISIFNKDSK
ncbi:MAG: hypothetical protein ACLRQF_11750 [Thomasclavelia ramosa]